MREPSSRGIRGLTGRGCLFALLLLAFFGANTASAQAITRFVRDTGHINFVTTGGSLRTQPNDEVTNTVECQVAPTSTQTLSGIPVGTSVRSAYLYWGGSGGTADTSVSLNGSTVTASRTFARTFVNGGTNYPYFGGFANVTSLVSGNGSFQFGNLTVTTGSPHCDRAAVVAGWALFVIYESPTERLRAINIFDGLDDFFGSQVTLTPDGFRVPPSNIDGRIAVFTLEGDPGNSDASGGVDEALRFNGNLLDDGLVPTNSVPTVQQFDGTINTQGVLTSYGIDVDQYDVSAFLSPGQTNATTVYSAGADLVLLMAQVVSATSEPAVDLTVTKTHTGTFVTGVPATYAITVTNVAGNEREDNTVTVTDTLPAGLTYNSASGAGWTCGAVGQVVTCTHPPTLDSGSSFPVLNLTVNVAQAAAASVTNTVTVSTPSYELVTNNNSTTDVTATMDPSLASSTKTVLDVNAGEASPGDTLRYTITLTESLGGEARLVSLTDDIPANTTFGGFVSVGGGGTGSFAAGGANGNGVITVTGMTVPASGSITVVFDVTVVAGALAGQTIANTANITNPNGADATPAAPTLTVNPSMLPSTGTKFVYLRRVATVKSLSRTIPTSATDTAETVVNGAPDTFAITAPGAFSIATGGIAVRLWLTRTGNSPSTRNVTLTLTTDTAPVFTTTVTANIAPPNAATPTLFTFTLPNAAPRSFVANTTFTLTVTNAGSSNISIFPHGNSAAGNTSRIEFNATTVVNVSSVVMHTSPYPASAAAASFYPGATVYARAIVTDPFGANDISAANITIAPGGIGPTAMPRVPAGSCTTAATATCTFEYQYVIPASPTLGGYTVSVTAVEGLETSPMVTDLGVGNFTVVIPQPSLTILKTSSVVSDPFNNTTNPKRIPNSVVRYSITVTNSGPGTIDSGTLVLTDPIPTNSSLYVATPGTPIAFINGSGGNASGYSYSYPGNVAFSQTGPSGPWGYTPVPDVDGFDATIRAIAITPSGVMSAAGGGNNPTFTLEFRVRVN